MYYPKGTTFEPLGKQWLPLNKRQGPVGGRKDCNIAGVALWDSALVWVMPALLG